MQQKKHLAFILGAVGDPSRKKIRREDARSKSCFFSSSKAAYMVLAISSCPMLLQPQMPTLTAINRFPKYPSCLCQSWEEAQDGLYVFDIEPTWPHHAQTHHPRPAPCCVDQWAYRETSQQNGLWLGIVLTRNPQSTFLNSVAHRQHW